MKPSAPPTTTPSPLPSSSPPSAPPPPPPPPPPPSASSSSFPSPPDATVPSSVEDLAWIISVGGCPECGSIADCARVVVAGGGGGGKKTTIKAVGSSSKSKSSKSSSPRSISPFLCSSCSITFYMWDERLRTRRDGRRRRRRRRDDDGDDGDGDGDGDDYDNNNYDDNRTYLGKRKLMSIARDAYEGLCRGEMIADRNDFVREMGELRRKIRAERRRVFGLLELPLEEEEAGGEEEYDDTVDGGSSSSRDVGTREAVVGVDRETTSLLTTTRDGEGSTMTVEGDDPFGRSILLIRRATMKLETVVAKLLLRCGDLTSSSSSSSSSVADERTTPSGENEDDTSSFVDVAYDRLPAASVTPSGGGGEVEEYRLASRIRQEGGEEIEIFEKCSTTGEG